MNRLERLYAVNDELRRNAPAVVSAANLANKFGVSRRTMERDLASLRSAGVPLYAVAGRRGGQATLQDGAPTHVFALSAEEITGLLMAVTASAPMPFGDAAVAGAQRLLDGLPSETQVRVDELRGRIRVSLNRPHGVGEVEHSTEQRAAAADGQVPDRIRRVQRVVEEAVRHRQVVNLKYRDQTGSATSRAVEAVGFFRGSDGWFLIGWCRLRQDRRIFRLDRITAAALTKESFSPRSVDETLGWVPEEVTDLG